MPGPKETRYSSRTNPFGPSGYLGDPDPLYNVDEVHAPDIAKLPWERRTYDAWTTTAFRTQVLAWIAAMFAANAWMYTWKLRERATQGRLGLRRLMEPVLDITITRKSDGRAFETSSSWLAIERDTPAMADVKLAAMRAAIEALNAEFP